MLEEDKDKEWFSLAQHNTNIWVKEQRRMEQLEDRPREIDQFYG
jgi:hypothetical protein